MGSDAGCNVVGILDFKDQGAINIIPTTSLLDLPNIAEVGKNLVASNYSYVTRELDNNRHAWNITEYLDEDVAEN
ncbi:MAG: hypothetical protein A2845_03405 [Candidatus Lloydbacteria bacterium RIFCSPHIGHO2_01_FULL_49_22]|uniref:Uncharacterized protein n=1 Tax=Candidatus Lloydbacteria bacterium RIFCSPHIGHO2_01_FULL_49_22 TaxID=1798658 RepID=A0A1G2CWS0_9BACT|nr:MAG: hypothetical protein A2845_03405 [Candidatus Lloydbacteria bacterium RIFCSPHIGHO2_01_FULL_49_22]OGZ08978.1 MAG: hypothetical protein A3C14_03240 [Candidatus Lloydbacteria bacterium RIFCSPHIGHO2_02_FULL_50_18]